MPWQPLDKPSEGAATVMLEDGRIMRIGPDARVLDAASATWKPVAQPLVAATHRRAVVMAEGWVHVSGGRDVASCELYKPETDVWLAMPPLPAPRTYHAVAIVSGRIWLFEVPLLSWSPGETEWTPVRGSPGRIGREVYVLADETLFVRGGFLARHWNHVTWSDEFAVDPMCAIVALASGGIGAFGGHQYGKAMPFARTWTAHDGWRDREPLPDARVNATAVQLRDGRVVVLGGDHVTEAFIDDDGTWLRIATPPLGQRPKALALRDGRIYIDSEGAGSGLLSL